MLAPNPGVQPPLPGWPLPQVPIQKPLVPLRMKPKKEICPAECDAELRGVLSEACTSATWTYKALPLPLRCEPVGLALASQFSQGRYPSSNKGSEMA